MARIYRINERDVGDDLVVPARRYTFQEIIETDPLGLCHDDEDSMDNIYVLRHVSPTRTQPEWVAERAPCSDFDAFVPKFQACASEWKAGLREAVRFARETSIRSGDFFVLRGQVVYVAERQEPEIRTARRHRDAQLRCIVDNGTEYNPLLRSLARSLYKDKIGRRLRVVAV